MYCYKTECNKLGWPPILQRHHYEITPSKRRESIFYLFYFLFVCCWIGWFFFFFGELCKRVQGREKCLLGQLRVYMYGLLKDFILFHDALEVGSGRVFLKMI